MAASVDGQRCPSAAGQVSFKVKLRPDGESSANVPARQGVALSEEKLVDPAKLAKTPGTLTSTAPDERTRSATIPLTATSRRGKATLKLTANTGGRACRVSGVSDQVSFSGEICSLEKIFSIDGAFPGRTLFPSHCSPLPISSVHDGR